MKTQIITTLAALTGIISTTTADAGSFNLGKVVRTAQTINRTVNNAKYNGGQKITYPSPNPPVYTHPVVTPLPHPGHGHKPVCKPKPPVCKPPVTRPPVKCYTMKLMNNAGAEVYYTLNKSDDYETMPMNDVDMIKSHSPQSHLISYHNGQELVEYELDPSATYSFEWQGETLMLLEIQG